MAKISKKKTLTSLAAVTLALSSTITAFAYISPTAVFFGQNTFRTHQNSQLKNGNTWTRVASVSGVGGLSTPIGDGSTLVNASSATQSLYIYDTSSWKSSGGGLYTPAAQPITVPMSSLGLSPTPVIFNSSPIYVPATGMIYLQTKDWLLEINKQGTLINHVSISFDNPASGVEHYSNTPPVSESYLEAVSYPLYTSASDLNPRGIDSPSGLSIPIVDTIWVSSQNGILYAISASDLHVIWAENLRTRLDASPSLVTADNGQTFVAVTGASSPNNSAIPPGQTQPVNGQGSGYLFLINPLNWNVYSFANSKSTMGSVSAPIGVSQSNRTGTIMWNNISADVFRGHVTTDKNGNAVLQNFAWSLSKYNGQDVADNSESAFDALNHHYIIPISTGGGTGVGVYYTQSTNNNYRIVAGSLAPAGSSEIDSNGNIYLADKSGNMDQLNVSPNFGLVGVKQLFSDGAGTGGLTTPSLLYLNNPWGTQSAFLAMDTSGGMVLYTDLGETLNWSANYTSSEPTKFSSPLTLAVKSENLPNDPNNHDTITFSMSVNGGKSLPLSNLSWYPYNGGTPRPAGSTYQLSTTQLNNALATYKAKYGGWKSTGANSVVITASKTTTDAFNYDFSGENPIKPNDTSATVTISFPAPIVAPPTTTGKSGNLVVPQWYLAKYFKYSGTAARLTDSIYLYPQGSAPRGGWWVGSPHLSPSGSINFLGVDPTGLQDWLYSSKTDLYHDTNVKPITYPFKLSESFNTDADLLAVKSNDTTFNHSLLAKWLNSTSPFTTISSTTKNSLGSKSTISKSQSLQYSSKTGRTFTLSQEYKYEYSCGSAKHPATCIGTGTWSEQGVETDQKINYANAVTFNQYLPSPSKTPNTFTNKTDTTESGFAYYTQQSPSTLYIDPEVLQFYDQPNPATSFVPTLPTYTLHGVFTAGQRLRPIKPVSYSSVEFDGTMRPYATTSFPVSGEGLPGLKSALMLPANSIGIEAAANGAQVLANVTSNATITARTFTLDVNPLVKSTWGNSTYSPVQPANAFLNSLGTGVSASSTSPIPQSGLKLPTTTTGDFNITHLPFGKNLYGGVTKDLHGNEKGTKETDYYLVIRGGQFLSIGTSLNNDTQYSATTLQSAHPRLYQALVNMHIISSPNIFNAFEQNQGTPLTENDASGVNIANLANTIRGTTGTTEATQDGKGWYSEDSRMLMIREYATTFTVPSMNWGNHISNRLNNPSDPNYQYVKGVVDPTYWNGSNLYLDTTWKLPNGSFLEYDPNSMTPNYYLTGVKNPQQMSPRTVSLIVSNHQPQNQLTFGGQ
jgi:hypothetical protein